MAVKIQNYRRCAYIEWHNLFVSQKGFKQGKHSIKAPVAAGRVCFFAPLESTTVLVFNSLEVNLILSLIKHMEAILPWAVADFTVLHKHYAELYSTSTHPTGSITS